MHPEYYGLISICILAQLLDRNPNTFKINIDTKLINTPAVRIGFLDILSPECGIAIQNNEVSTLLEITARHPTVYNKTESHGQVLMETLVAGSFHMDLPFSNSFQSTTQDLLLAFSQFIKMKIASEIWFWKSVHSPGTLDDWWADHKSVEALCNRDPHLPSRVELDEYYDAFQAYVPKDQDFTKTPIITDPVFIDKIWNPTLPFVMQTRIHSDSRRLFISREERYVGLAPKSAKVGDEVWIVPGSRTPFVLRRREGPIDRQEEGRDGREYEFLGEAYVHGLMGGEFFQRGSEARVEDLVLR